MSRNLFLIPLLHQSFPRRLQQILRNSFSPQIFSSKICSVCLQNHRSFASTRQSHAQQTTFASAAASEKHESERSSPEAVEPKTSDWQQHQPEAWKSQFQPPEPQLNWEYLCNPDNLEFIRENIAHRKGVGDIDKVVSRLAILVERTSSVKETE